jgi:hypothetical protein
MLPYLQRREAHELAHPVTRPDEHPGARSLELSRALTR